MKKFLLKMNDEDKINLIVKATKEGIDIEEELIPALDNAKKMFNESLLLKNLRFMELKEEEEE